MKGYQWVMPQNDAGVIAALQSQPLFVSQARSIRLLMLIAGLWICNPVKLHTIGSHASQSAHSRNQYSGCRLRSQQGQSFKTTQVTGLTAAVVRLPYALCGTA